MKILFFVFSFIVLQLGAYSMNVENYCPKAPYNLTSSGGAAIAKYSGANFLTQKLIEKIIQKELNKELNTNFDVELKQFSNNNLLNGKFHSLSVLGHDVNRKGLFFSTVSAQTICGYNHVKYENNSLYFLENMVVKFSARMTENDLNKILNSNEYVNYLKNLKFKANNYVLAEITNVQAKIKDNKLVLKTDVLMPFIFGSQSHSINITTGLNVENGKINFSNIKTNNSMLDLLLQNSDAFLDKINPFVYKVQSKEKYDIMLNVENVKIENNEIFITGAIVIPKNY